MSCDQDRWMTKEDFLSAKETYIRNNWGGPGPNMDNCVNFFRNKIAEKIDSIENYARLVGLSLKIDFELRIPIHVVRDVHEYYFEFFKNGISLGIITYNTDSGKGDGPNLWISSFRKYEIARLEAEDIEEYMFSSGQQTKSKKSLCL